MKEKIDVLMPCYNAVEYLDAAILSMLSQTHSEFTILAYDDWSDDGTFERLQFWNGVDSRIVSRRPFTTHTGYVELLNQMLEDSGAEFVARQDADDMSLPHRLDLQLSFMKRTQNAVLCGSKGVNLIQQESRIVTDYPWEAQYVNPVASYEIPVNEALKEQHRIIHGSLFSKRELIKRVGGYDKELVPLEDWDLVLKVASHGDVYVLPAVLYVRRIHPANISKNHPNKNTVIQTIVERHRLSRTDFQTLRPKHL